MVVTANREVRTKEEATVYVRELDSFVAVMLLDNTPAVLSLGKLCEEVGCSYQWTSGQKPHLIKNAKKIHCDTSNHVPFVVPGLSTSSSTSSTSPTSSSKETVTNTEIPATRRRESTRLAREDPLHRSAEIEKKKATKNYRVMSCKVRQIGYRSSSMDWLMNVFQNIKTLPILLKNFLWNREQKWHRSDNIFTHFPKDRKCEICKRTKITRAPCRRRNGEAVPRAANFGDLKTADHKVLSDNCESRNNHRYAVVVQDLATQWIQSYPCKTKISQETQRSFHKFFELTRKPKVIYTGDSLEFGKACDDLSWNHCTSKSHRSETNGNAERAVRRIKEGTSAVLLQIRSG